MDFFEKLNTLPENVREYFCGNDLRLALEQACFLYEIREEDIKRVSKSIAKIFFKELELRELPLMMEKEFNFDNKISSGIAFELNSRIFSRFADYFLDAKELLRQWEQNKIPPIISEEKAWRRVLDIEPWILEKEKEEKTQKAVAQKKIENISINDAMKKYPNFGEQNATVNPLKLKYFPAPVRPSIKNWITDFHDNMGAGKHSAIDRGNYLFHSENGKKLTPVERQKLSLILKSVDENSPIAIDPEKQTIIFDSNDVAEGTQSMNKTSIPPQNVSVEHFFGKENKSGDAENGVFQKYFGTTNGAQKINEEVKAEPQKKDVRPIPEAIPQPKKQPETNNYFSSFASSSDNKAVNQRPANTGGVISFSSPQKLPIEQKTGPAEQSRPATRPETKPQSQPQLQNKPQSQFVQTSAHLQMNNVSFPRKQNSQSMWKIKPRDFNDNEEDILKSSGKVVNLKKLN